MNRMKLVCALFLSLATAACAPTQQRVTDAQNAVDVPDKHNFFERKQIAQAEIMNDRPGKVYWWYILSDDGGLITSITCVGRPASSTESLEPNNAYAGYGLTYGFQVPMDGADAFSTEMMGIDGTFGDPVPFRYCITPEGHYMDVSMFQKTIVSSIPLTFPAPEVRFDAELEAKKLIAERTLANKGCIDSNLNPISCADVKKNTEQ